MEYQKLKSRRTFIKSSGILGAGLILPHLGLANQSDLSQDLGVHQFGKRDGYGEQMSILISMMDWMRSTVLRSVRGISQKELDFLIDDEANSIGSMLLHLAATERFYQIHTFENKNWGDWSTEDAEKWGVASGLGNDARKMIKDNPISYYTDALEGVREKTRMELKNRDDSWLMESTNFFGGQPTNNYCKWFHVVEHESNHNGQIKFIKSRVV